MRNSTLSHVRQSDLETVISPTLLLGGVIGRRGVRGAGKGTRLGLVWSDLCYSFRGRAPPLLPPVYNAQSQGLGEEEDRSEPLMMRCEPLRKREEVGRRVEQVRSGQVSKPVRGPKIAKSR